MPPRRADLRSGAVSSEPARRHECMTRQRIDTWLWFARVVKSRTLAARLVEEGHVRVNGIRTQVPAKPVAPGDVLTIALERQVRVLRVIAIGERRGPFLEASLLFEEIGETSLL